MSYRFKANESVSQAVERIALERLDKAFECTAAKTNFDEAVHDARVCFKKLRALIRLVRDELGDKQYGRENVFYRDLSRKLSEVRDTAALTEILDKLQKHFAEELTAGAFDSTRQLLTRATRKRQTEKRKALLEVRRQIPVARKQIEKWLIKKKDFSAVGPGLSRIYARGRAGFRKAQAEQSVESLHEWRKDAKYFWYHIGLLRPLWSKPLKGFARQIEELVGHLSDDHDLAILRERLLAQSSDLNGDHEAEALMALIDKRRAELQTQAWILGDRIYAERPKAFQARLHEYWQAWQTEQKTNPLAAR
jgi:CHAD domain-containing protein